MAKRKDMKGCKIIAWGSYYECTGDYPICEGCQYKGEDNTVNQNDRDIWKKVGDSRG